MAATKSGAGKPKLTGEQKKAARAAKRVQRKQTWKNLLQAFQMTRKTDKLLVPIMVGAFVVVVAVVWAIGSLALGQPLYFTLPLGALLGLAVAMLLFSRRAQTSAYSQAEGQPGAAAYVLDNLRGDWRVKQAVAGNTHLDAVHRLIGRPGIVLVGEGAAHRIRGLVAQEKKKTARVAGDTPIYDVIVGRDDDEVPLAKLNGYLMRLPRNLSAEQVSALDRRLAALGGGKMPLPQGPMPQGAKMRNVARTARRRS
ncbi:DUF4191 domain-containing protein [Jatrophihabitans sp. YIM 134969]